MQNGLGATMTTEQCSKVRSSEPDGEPVLNDEGFARVTNVNDEFGRTIEQAFFGIQGEPVVGTKNYRYHR